MHTPGPWKLDRYIDSGNDNPGSIIAENPHGEGPEEIASVDWIGGGWHEEQVANARLIAAAPALLEALKACVLVFDSLAETGVALPRTYADARAAIAAARGEGVTA